jgi:hypothetical protein
MNQRMEQIWDREVQNSYKHLTLVNHLSLGSLAISIFLSQSSKSKKINLWIVCLSRGKRENLRNSKNKILFHLLLSRETRFFKVSQSGSTLSSRTLIVKFKKTKSASRMSKLWWLTRMGVRKSSLSRKMFRSWLTLKSCWEGLSTWQGCKNRILIGFLPTFPRLVVSFHLLGAPWTQLTIYYNQLSIQMIKGQ